ncbi:hypothetical protein C8R45DRAFT_929210 [Mycena sanguinolenta]|nr:hypothetical protein C8R45DRAFT_929210 [Mycena sanguinolenta]
MPVCCALLFFQLDRSSLELLPSPPAIDTDRPAIVTGRFQMKARHDQVRFQIYNSWTAHRHRGKSSAFVPIERNMELASRRELPGSGSEFQTDKFRNSNTQLLLLHCFYLGSALAERRMKHQKRQCLRMNRELFPRVASIQADHRSAQELMWLDHHLYPLNDPGFERAPYNLT